MPRELSIIQTTDGKFLVRTEKMLYQAEISFAQSKITIAGLGLIQSYDLRNGALSPFLESEIPTEDLVLLATILAEAFFEDTI